MLQYSSRQEDGVLDLYHTEVPSSQRGRGLGGTLAEVYSSQRGRGLGGTLAEVYSSQRGRGLGGTLAEVYMFLNER